MGKRSSFQRIANDAYDTPVDAVFPLVRHLPESFTYVEPCAGRGSLFDHITTLIGGARCKAAWDVAPRRWDIDTADALSRDLPDCDYVITNPPWSRDLLHPMIERFSSHRPTWLLFDADWMHTKQSSHLMAKCRKLVSIGRVKWIEGSKMTGKDNCCWYLFGPDRAETVFVGR